jgi:hypothetical protein
MGVLLFDLFHFCISRLSGYHKKPNIAAKTAATMARKAPIADNPAPGPIYAKAGSGKKQAMDMIRTADVNR